MDTATSRRDVTGQAEISLGAALFEQAFSSSLLRHILTASCFQVKRHAEFTELKKQIILYMEELDRVPETSFEKDVVCEDEDSFCLSRDNITSLKLLLCQVSRIFFFFA